MQNYFCNVGLELLKKRYKLIEQANRPEGRLACFLYLYYKPEREASVRPYLHVRSVSGPFHVRFMSVFEFFRKGREKTGCSFVDKVDYL